MNKLCSNIHIFEWYFRRKARVHISCVTKFLTLSVIIFNTEYLWLWHSWSLVYEKVTRSSRSWSWKMQLWKGTLHSRANNCAHLYTHTYMVNQIILHSVCRGAFCRKIGAQQFALKSFPYTEHRHFGHQSQLNVSSRSCSIAMKCFYLMGI